MGIAYGAEAEYRGSSSSRKLFLEVAFGLLLPRPTLCFAYLLPRGRMVRVSGASVIGYPSQSIDSPREEKTKNY